MEYLSRRLEMLKEDRRFKFHPKCSKMKLTHLIFADDLLMFGKADMSSIISLNTCLQDFCQVSGLEANPTKCAVYLCGVEDNLKAQICTYLSFSEGTLPMRYLGLPLTTRRISHFECSSLINKITNQFQNWQQNRSLSYAGRIQMIKSVILGIQTFWFSNYILPTKILEKIDRLCSAFLWGQKIHLISWDSVCLNKKKEGLGLFSAKVWNQASAVKLLWMIHQKKDILWIKWIHGHYLKNSNVWQVQQRVNDSWMWKQLLKTRNMILEKYGNADEVLNILNSCSSNGKLRLSLVYNILTNSSAAINWSETTWGRLNYPKHSIIIWLAFHSRLLTQERLCRFRILSTNCCVLCSRQPENCKHLFFECQYSAEVWNNVMDWLGYTWRSCTWVQLSSWYSSCLKGKGFKKDLKRMALSVAVYFIWQERNVRIFQGIARTPDTLFRAIKVSIFTRILNDDFPAHIKEMIVNL
ncbi:uncharacterized protein LOC109831221 [Asparagus officinalis]|uniref:uncharacterized protein LOC109831221 n=1 Tax=Asparagus officinalis TaxID=4686 RepID=UPI00098E2C77|nr:uncharacterized protein LOC109831221 [Asparagus officinalis]